MVTTTLFFGRKDKTANKTAYNFDKEKGSVFLCLVLFYIYSTFFITVALRYAICDLAPDEISKKKNLETVCVYCIQKAKYISRIAVLSVKKCRVRVEPLLSSRPAKIL